MAFRKDNKVKNSFSKISIALASPEEILEQSSGEVLKPETINYRTYKPERDGLFCEKIFGPVKDFECRCGKYKGVRYKGIVCDRCGVEVTEKKVRRERMGHINLVVPVAHNWYFRSTPNKIGYLLGLPSKTLDAIIYYEKYVVLQPGVFASEGVTTRQLLTEEEYLDLMDKLPMENLHLEDSDPNKFIAKMGAEAVYEMLKEVDLDSLSFELRNKASQETSQQRKNEALKRLQVVEAFRASHGKSRPEWMIVKVVPVIPPEMHPFVPLDDGRFATSDLNDLYRRVIIRNNRLKRLIEIHAPEVILRNERRMLQEAVDSLFDNSKRETPINSANNRVLKSLSDNLKGKQGRFRQNLLGKRVDYSARSVIVPGPELKMHECGMPKEMAAELYKPFVIRKLIERDIVKTVKSAKKIVDRKDPIVWDILEYVMKGHPVLLNRAPTLHRLGIQAFQPKLIDGKAIQLHPLACTAFNADFDGDQMAVHLPLGNEAVLEAQMLMLGSHNILNPANGAPITVPAQDMVLGLYYITKERPGTKGEGLKFYGMEEAQIAYNEQKVDLHAPIQVIVDDVDENGSPIRHMIQTTVGRLIFNQYVPKSVGFVNELISKKSLTNVISKVVKTCGVARTAQFLDDIKNLGFDMAFKGCLSLTIEDLIIPKEKEKFINEGYSEVENVMANYSMGMITPNECYNSIISIWTKVNNDLTDVLMKTIKEDEQGFNSVYMMLDSGACGSIEQIRRISGMCGLMSKPQKAGADGGQFIENPILSNFKEGLSVLEYFISTHGARKGLADTALKTADAGYLTRRLIDVSYDVIINQEDCGTLRGLVCTDIKKNDDVIVKLGDRILGRVSVHDVVNPETGEVIVMAGQEIREGQVDAINAAKIEKVEIRSVLTCESKRGVCAKCYGRNLATDRMVQEGEAVGVIAAQSIGEPGLQLTLRTFHAGGIEAGYGPYKLKSKYDGVVEFEELKAVDTTDENDQPVQVVVGRMGEARIVNPTTKIEFTRVEIPYGSKLFFKQGQEVKIGDTICEWDPFNAIIVTEVAGKVAFENLIEGVTCRTDHYFKDKDIIESKDETKSPVCHIINEDGDIEKTYRLPVGSTVVVSDGEKLKKGQLLVKIPRVPRKSGDITGGLPRVQELFEAHNPSNPAIVAEIDGEVSFGKVKRGKREISITSKFGEVKKYLVSLSKPILVQEGDYVRAGNAISDGAICPSDILAILGPTAVQEYIVNGLQDVYRLHGLAVNDKHFEVIVRQMMRKVQISDPGDILFLENDIVDKLEFMEENDKLFDKKIVVDAGGSTNFKPGQVVTVRNLRAENSMLKRRDLKIVTVRDAIPATATLILQGITSAALQTRSFMSSASFQQTTKVLNDASLRGKTDYLEGMKENVICGKLIPAGTGLAKWQNIVVETSDNDGVAIEVDSDNE